MKRSRRDDDLLFALAPARYFELLGEVELRLQLGVLGSLHPYRLRHTGASHNFASSARDLASVQRRGRWREKRSLRRCEEGGRLSELLQRLPPGVQGPAALSVRHVGAGVLGQRSPCRGR